jgi:hypothetical protein
VKPSPRVPSWFHAGWRSAVIRNRVKRRLREIYRRELHALVPGLCIVVTAKPASATAGIEELRSEWLRLGKRLSIFHVTRDCFFPKIYASTSTVGWSHPDPCTVPAEQAVDADAVSIPVAQLRASRRSKSTGLSMAP